MKRSAKPLETDPACVVGQTMARWWARTTPAVAAFLTEGGTVEKSMTWYSLIYALAVTDTWMQLPAPKISTGSTPRSSNIVSFSPSSGSGKTES